MAQVQSRAVAAKNAQAPVQALLAGTPVLTMDGELPVEFLQPGDRVLTRSGMRRLAQVAVTVIKSSVISTDSETMLARPDVP